LFLKMFNKLEARVLSEYKRSRAAPSTFCTLIKHYFSFIKHYKINLGRVYFINKQGLTSDILGIWYIITF
jgi:hypothetical protein